MTELESTKFDDCIECKHLRVRDDRQVNSRTCRQCVAGEEFEEAEPPGIDDFLRDNYG